MNEKEIQSVLDEEVVESILDEDSGWYLCGDKFNSIVEVRRHSMGFTILSEKEYEAGFNNKGEMVWFTRDVL